jgi:glycine betaine transporter
MIACIGLLVFIFVLGPTRYILDNMVNSVGIYIQNFVSMSLWTDPVANTGWLDGWTVFYWAWWISWAPFVAMFIAKISKGRTIKEFVIASIIAPTIFDIIFFSILGSTALSIEMNPATKGIIENAISAEVGNGIFVLLSQFPMSTIITPVILFVVFTFFVVSADSATIVLGMLSSGGDDSPRISLKILWGVAMAVCSAILIFMGGLDAIQTIAIIAVFPFIFIMFFLFYNTIKMVKEE